MLGVAGSQGGSLRSASDDFIESLMQSNNYLRRANGYQQASVGGNTALMTQLSGRSPVTGQNEVVNVYTTPLRDGSLFYVIAVAPQQEYGTYQRTFQNIVRSVRLNSR